MGVKFLHGFNNNFSKEVLVMREKFGVKGSFCTFF
jgi:hypothetical protein